MEPSPFLSTPSPTSTTKKVVLPKEGRISFDSGRSLKAILCKPKILPIKSFSLHRLEELEEKIKNNAQKRREEERIKNEKEQNMWGSAKVTLGSSPFPMKANSPLGTTTVDSNTISNNPSMKAPFLGKPPIPLPPSASALPVGEGSATDPAPPFKTPSPVLPSACATPPGSIPYVGSSSPQESRRASSEMQSPPLPSNSEHPINSSLNNENPRSVNLVASAPVSCSRSISPVTNVERSVPLPLGGEGGCEEEEVGTPSHSLTNVAYPSLVLRRFATHMEGDEEQVLEEGMIAVEEASPTPPLPSTRF